MDPREHDVLQERLAATEERLREIGSRHRLLIDSWAQAVWETDASGMVVADSPSWRAYTGQTLEEWFGYGWLGAVHPDDRAYAERQWREAISARRLVDAELRLRTPNGRWRWTNVRAAPVLDPQGWIEKWVGMNIDISAAKEAETALRESEEKYRTLFETMGQGYAECEMVRDAEGGALDVRYIELNPSWERLTGLSVADVRGRTAREVVPGLEDWWIEMYDRVVTSGTPERIEHDAAPLGRYFEVQVYPGSGDRFSVLYDDITERKRQVFSAVLLAQIGDDLARLSSPDEIIQAVGARLGSALHLSGCIFANVDEAANEATIHHGWNTADVASLRQTFKLADYFGEEFRRAGRAGETLVVRDTMHDKRANAEAYARLNLGSFVTVPFLRHSRWVANITATTRGPRDWHAGEITLLQEVANRVFPRIERARAEASLRESEKRFQQFAAASASALWIRNAETLEMEYASPAIANIYGIDPVDFLDGVELLAASIVPEDRDRALGHLNESRHGEAVVHEFRIQRRSDQAFRWVRNTDFPLIDLQGRVQRIGGIAEDVTEAKLAVEHQGVLLAELQHRVRNIMAMIRSMVRRSAEGAADVGEYQSLLEGRLLALARVQALLTRQANAGGSLRDIIHSEVSAQAHHEGQFELVGPDVQLSPKAVEVLTLALHELSTNALKYGALSVAEGCVRVKWALFEKRGRSWLGIDWTETGAPSRGPTTRRGFGSDLIEGKIPYELGGTGRIVIEPSGARCRLEFPLKDGESILETDAPVPATVFGGTLDMTGAPDLTSRNVLVVEDDYYLAGDTAAALRGAGAEVLGPCPSEEAALDLLETETPSHAVLDLNLGGGGPRFEIAHTLKARGVPFIFLTGYDPDVVPPDFADVVRLQKPVPLRTIVETIEQL